MDDWKMYTGSGDPHTVHIPPPPPWRSFTNSSVGDGPWLPTPKGESGVGKTFKATMGMVDAVNAALVLRRPLLLTGRPGSGKSSLIESVARELRLGRVLRWHVTSASKLSDALYRYDAVGRLYAHGLRRGTNDDKPVEAPEIQDYLEFGPLGTALIPSTRPRALLIDEIDKSDIDLPNDLLNVFERGEFEIPELTRMRHVTPVDIRVDGGKETYAVENGRVQCREFPFVVLTSNGERDFPAAFLRRCIRLRMPHPTEKLLAEIVAAHLGQEAASSSEKLIRDFAQRTENDHAYATDQLMNAIFLVTREVAPKGAEKARLLELLLKKLTVDVP